MTDHRTGDAPEESSVGEATPLAAGAGSPSEGDLAALRDRVDRLEQQLALTVKTFADRLNAHTHRLDRLDPPDRGWRDEPPIPSEPSER
jgi:hypothetical protein